MVNHNIALKNNKYNEKTIQTTNKNVIIATITLQSQVDNLLKLLSNGHSIKFEQNVDENGNSVVHIVGIGVDDTDSDNDYDEYTEKGNIVVI